MPILYSKVTTEPASEPITLSDAKAHLHVDHDEENQLISLLLQSARETIEQRTNRSLITQTRTLKLDYFPQWITPDGWGQITLPNGPVSSVTSITYVDEAEDSQPLSASDYWVDTSSGIARIIVKTSWPATFTMPNAVTVVYVAGYGAASSVPAALKSALLLVLGHLYENREQVGDIRYELPFGVDSLISPYVLEQSVKY
jgi:uncharacterized phiE125 gp8 family phage protein